MAKEIIRCGWAEHGELERAYHDEEWGVPVHDDLHLFQMLQLEGMQAGLSWSTILAKRESMHAAFADFVPEKLVRFDQRKVEALLQNPGIIRNRLKVNSAITNARAYLELVEQEGPLDAFLWRYVDGKPIVNGWTELSQIPAKTPLSDTISRDLKKRGFKFVGSTIIYAFMQAVGMVNDHMVSCFRYGCCQQAGK
ncbi:MAG: DNA-3-methyladenine glycosylase I [Verrucomicrobiota bacterium JB024]|jgi:DNA-3-methyladenine glycosylase I|nr:DNA-3-methyladenine glycosylase I [Verrucomicrobiota bacterium JB024]